MEASESLGDAEQRGEAAEQRHEPEEGSVGDDGPGLAISETSEGSNTAPATAVELAENVYVEAAQEISEEVTDGDSTSEREQAPHVEEGEGDSPRFEAHFPDSIEETGASEEEQPHSVEPIPDEVDDAGSDVPLDDEDKDEATATDPDEVDGSSGTEDASPPPPPTPMNSALSYKLSRGVMFNKYAGATPSTQEQQSAVQSSSWVAFDAVADASTALPSDVMHVCSSVACQQLMQWKDARIHELQRALDQMVEAMAIQQRDLAAQRALLSRQSEHFTKLSMALHHEKMAMQLNRERSNSAGRSRSQRSNMSAGLTVDSRRSTMPHVHSLPDITGGTTASIAIVEPPRVKARRSLMPPLPLPLTVLPLDDQPATPLDLREKSKSLSALEIRATTPQMPTIHEVDKFASDEAVPPVLLSEVSLHDREPSTAASTGTSDSSSDLLHGDPQSSTPQPDSVKKWSLGGRLRSIRWKN